MRHSVTLTEFLHREFRQRHAITSVSRDRLAILEGQRWCDVLLLLTPHPERHENARMCAELPDLDNVGSPDLLQPPACTGR